ncbi:MAG: hypothetical protein PF542_01660 [Nanoarchaeota archaeon]|jgi:hypothetical protein|nr:hypothetical protein [Nanoarchaeota archaeon]
MKAREDVKKLNNKFPSIHEGAVEYRKLINTYYQKFPKEIEE